MLITTADNHTGLSMLYIFHMFLFDHEAGSAFRSCAEVSEALKGLYLIGDVALDEYNDAGNIDIGSSMQTAYGVMRNTLKKWAAMSLICRHSHIMRNIFHGEWFTG